MALQKWIRSKPLNNPLAIKQLEEKYGFSLSEDLINCILSNNGAKPKPNKILLKNGEENDVKFACELLLSIPVERFIELIGEDYEFSSKDVFQYSQLNDAIIKLPNILYYEFEQLNFLQAGKRLISAKKDLACVKYGENHSKLAASFSLVLLEKTNKVTQIRLSSLGKYTIDMSVKQKHELIRRLALRNKFVKSLIFNAMSGNVVYTDLASNVLSGQTIVRRKHNVEVIANLILCDNGLSRNIRW